MRPFPIRPIFQTLICLTLWACASPVHDPESTPGDRVTEPSTDPETTSTTTDEPQTGDTGTSDTGEPTSPVEFELSSSIERSDDTLLFRSSLPLDMDDCEALSATGAPCEDVDEDDLVDTWEDLLLEAIRPVLRYDETEQLMDDPDAVLFQVGRVSPGGDGSIHVYIAILYSEDYGRCELTAHHGDSERVALRMVPLTDGGAGDVIVEQFYTAAHEDTVMDHGTMLQGSELASVEYAQDEATAQPRWQVYASDGKHAVYPTIEHCETAEWVPCLDEDCEAEGVADPAAYVRLPDIVNAGEAAAPRLSDLTVLGFPGEDAWLDQPFCGGLGREGDCSAPVRDKLQADPFD